jgi:hypothetical protein
MYKIGFEDPSPEDALALFEFPGFSGAGGSQKDKT